MKDRELASKAKKLLKKVGSIDDKEPFMKCETIPNSKNICYIGRRGDLSGEIPRLGSFGLEAITGPQSSEKERQRDQQQLAGLKSNFNFGFIALQNSNKIETGIYIETLGFKLANTPFLLSNQISIYPYKDKKIGDE